MNERKPLMTDMVSIKKTSRPAKKDVFVREPEMEDDDFLVQPQLVVHNNYSNENEDVKKKPINFLGVIIFFCVIMLILGIGGLFSSARIEITPIQKTGVVDITTIARNSQGKELLSFATATKVITETKIIPALGKTEKSSFAKGKIRFYNTKNIPIKITAGSVVVTADGVRYKTDTTVTVPKNQLTKQGQVDVKITAIEAGTSGNRGLDNFVFENKTIVGVTIQAITEMVGGTGQNELIADPELIMQAKKELQGSVIDEGVISNRLAEELPEDFIKLPLQIPASIPVITVESNHSDGVHVVARRSITIAMVKKKQLAQIIAKNMGADMDRQMTLDSFEGMTVVAGSLGTLPNQTKELPLRITGQATIYGFVDTDSIKANILEKTKKQTKEFLANSKEIDSVTIRMTPPWRNVMPKDSKNISFLIKKGVN